MMEIPQGLRNQASVIICTVDRFADLEECLDSLRPFRTAVAEVIVVNNGPHLTKVEEIAARHEAKIVTEPRRGVSRARNAGILEAVGSIVAFLDDDSVADADWLPQLLSPFGESQVVAVVGSILPRSAADPLSQAFDFLHRAQFPQTMRVMGGGDVHHFPLREALIGNANMAIRREAFDRYGWFDSRFGRGTRIGSGEEPDFLLRVLVGGGKIMAQPAAQILHRHRTSKQAVRRWAFRSGCAHTAILAKYFFASPCQRGAIRRYTLSRFRPRSMPKALAGKIKFPHISFLLGSLYGPAALLLSGKERKQIPPPKPQPD